MYCRSCPNCGAPVLEKTYKCEYCGSVFLQIEYNIGNDMKNLKYKLNFAKVILAQQIQNNIIITNLKMGLGC